MSKLDPILKRLSSQEAVDRHGVVARRMIIRAAVPTPVANVILEVEEPGDDAILSRLESLGFVARARSRQVVTGDMPLDVIARLEGIQGLRRVEASRPLLRELDLALPEAHVVAVHTGPPPQRGAGVIVGIIDHGIDYRHQSFRKAGGGSRILAIWDQGIDPQGTEAHPAGFGYGVEYKQAAIDAALASAAPLSVVRHQDRAPFHGTHVAGIAAGNGRPADPTTGDLRYVGVAPDADLVIVANTRPDPDHGPDDGYSSSSDTLDAVNYILQVAANAGKPVVINLSQGDNIGPHDGTSLLERGIDDLITGPGRALVKSAGNEAERKSHARGTLPAGGSADVKIKVSSGSREVVVDFWYPGVNTITLTITPPGGVTTTVFGAPSTGTMTLSNGNTAFVDADLNDPANGDNRTFVSLRPGSQAVVEPGVWTFRLQGGGPWDGWIQRNSNAVFMPPFVSKASTITIPGTSKSVITAGSYISNADFTLGTVGELSDLSSHGPTRDGRRAPTLTAPGEEITAPQPGNTFGARKGTSMSAAMVSGAVALLFEADGSRTAADIRWCLEGTARLDAHTGAAPGNEWGAGKLDVEAACQRASPVMAVLQKATTRSQQP